MESDTFEQPCHKLKPSIEAKLEALLKEYASQFAQDETFIAMTPLMEMMIDTGASEPVLQKPYPITGKGGNREATYSKSDMRKPIQLVNTHHSCPKRRWTKMPSDWLLHTQ